MISQKKVVEFVTRVDLGDIAVSIFVKRKFSLLLEYRYIFSKILI
jgi:hypothetical protein